MLGTKLREAREARQLSLHEVEWATKINANFLAALEAEEFDKLPAAVYARGFIRNYALHLGLDPAPLVSEYNSLHATSGQIVSTRPPVRPERRPLAITPGMVAGVVMLLLISLFGVYLKGQFDRYQASHAQDASPSPGGPVVADLPSPSPSPSASPSPSPRVYTGEEIVVRVDDTVWLRVEVDGKVSDLTTDAGKVFPAGSVITFPGTKTVHVRSGKAAHTFITENGKDIGPMAPPGSATVGDKTYQKV